MESLAKHLRDSYPSVIVRGSIIETHCGKGWWPLVWPVAKAMHAHNLEMEEYGVPPVHFSQIKEKFGTLRLYVSGPGWRIVDREIEFAERASSAVCEQCGKPGRTNNDGWLRTECKGHEKCRTEGN